MPGTCTHSFVSAIFPDCTLTTTNAHGHISVLSEANVAASSAEKYAPASQCEW